MAFRTCCTAGVARRHQRKVALESGFCQLKPVVVQGQCAAHQPGLGDFRTLAGQGVELAGGIWIASRLDQGAGIFETNLCLWFAIKVFFDQRLGRCLFGGHQRQRQQGRSLGVGVKCLRFAGRLKSAVAIARLHAHPADRGPGGYT